MIIPFIYFILKNRIMIIKYREAKDVFRRNY